jgi:hypothetical protein
LTDPSQSPQTADDFRRRAQEFQALADGTHDLVVREQLLHLVEIYLELAKRLEERQAAGGL